MNEEFKQISTYWSIITIFYLYNPYPVLRSIESMSFSNIYKSAHTTIMDNLLATLTPKLLYNCRRMTHCSVATATCLRQAAFSLQWSNNIAAKKQPLDGEFYMIQKGLHVPLKFLCFSQQTEASSARSDIAKNTERALCERPERRLMKRLVSHQKRIFRTSWA